MWPGCKSHHVRFIEKTILTIGNCGRYLKPIPGIQWKWEAIHAWFEGTGFAQLLITSNHAYSPRKFKYHIINLVAVYTWVLKKQKWVCACACSKDYRTTWAEGRAQKRNSNCLFAKCFYFILYSLQNFASFWKSFLVIKKKEI